MRAPWHVGWFSQYPHHVEPLGNLQEQQHCDPAQHARVQSVEQHQRDAENRDDGEDIAAVEQAVHVAHEAENGEPPQEAPGSAAALTLQRSSAM
jgi:hypothetical protein